MTEFIVSFCDRLDRWTVPIFRRRAMKRLRAEIDVYQEELNCRGGAKCPALLDQARQAADDGQIDRGWRFLQATRRVELPATGSPELDAAAVSIREEAAKKLGSWRKDAVETLLPKGTPSPTRSRIQVILSETVKCSPKISRKSSRASTRLITA